MLIYKYITGPIQVNTYLAVCEMTNKGFVVDPGGYSRALEKEILEKGVDVEYIIFTHGHGDHIGGTMDLQKICKKAKTLASLEEKSMFENAGQNFSRETCGAALEFTPDILVGEFDTITIGKMELKFIRTPGHTKGGMCIYCGDVLFSGDTLFQQSIGRTDFPGGSFQEIKASIRNKLFILPEETKVLPGHMGDTTIGEEKRGNPFG